MNGFLHDGKGNKSSARLIVALWSTAILVVWVGVCAYKREMIDIPVGVGAILAYAVAGKTVQTFAEVKQ